MRIFVCLGLVALCISLCLAENGLDRDWKEWKSKYNKQYSTALEEFYRYTIWRRNLDYVTGHNNDVHSKFRLEMNAFADQEAGNRTQIHLPDNSNREGNKIEHNLVYLPSSFDWRTKGAITPVENQGQLGTTLPIVAVECMDSYGFIKTGRMIRTSEQEVIDCCTHGSSVMSPLFDCIHSIGGLCSAADYPPRGSAGPCKSSTCKPVVTNKGTNYVPKGSEDDLQMAVLQNPVIAAIDASHTSFQMYRSGVYYEPQCSPTQVDHLVQVVGYGSQDGEDYWIVKNSWGENWGMKGYIYMSRNKKNNCGIASAASYPL